jgi:hypothetical protein
MLRELDLDSCNYYDGIRAECNITVVVTSSSAMAR